MRARAFALAAGFAAGLAAAAASDTAFAAAKPRDSLIYKVDSASARVTGRKLVVHAGGAVSTGGWTNPRLHALPQRAPETDTLTIEFRAMPPAPDAAVIQALLPVSATATFPLPRYATTKVKIVTQTGGIVVPIQTKR